MKCLRALQVTFPNTYGKYSKEDFGALAQVWGIQFGNCTDIQVWTAMQTALAFAEYPPTIADIKSRMVSNDYESEEDIWHTILAAGRNAIYHAEDEYNKLPEKIRKVIRPGTLKEIALSDDESLQFIKKDILAEYRSYSSKEQSKRLLELGDERLMIGYETD